MVTPPRDWKRRAFLKAGAATTAAVTLGCASTAIPPAPRTRLRTPLCELLGIDHPVLQSGMAPIGGPS